MGPVLSKNLIGCKHCYKKFKLPHLVQNDEAYAHADEAEFLNNKLNKVPIPIYIG